MPRIRLPRVVRTYLELARRVDDSVQSLASQNAELRHQVATLAEEVSNLSELMRTT